jgi:hypothetical protein
MATPLSKFLAAATADNIRANNQWEMTATAGITEVDDVLKDAVMYCSNATIPNRDIEYAAVSYKGYSCENLVPVRLVMGNEFSVTLKLDTDGSYRRAFLAWMNSVMNADISGGSVFEGDRGVNDKSIVRIQLFDKDNKTVIETYKFYNVRVKSVGEVSLTYDGGEVATCSINFGSTYWEIESATKGSITG